MLSTPGIVREWGPPRCWLLHRFSSQHARGSLILGAVRTEGSQSTRQAHRDAGYKVGGVTVLCQERHKEGQRTCPQPLCTHTHTHIHAHTRFNSLMPTANCSPTPTLPHLCAPPEPSPAPCSPCSPHHDPGHRALVAPLTSVCRQARQGRRQDTRYFPQRTKVAKHQLRRVMVPLRRGHPAHEGALMAAGSQPNPAVPPGCTGLRCPGGAQQ